MTGKSDFTEEEWKTVLEAPPSAGLLVIASDRGGSIRESFSMAKAYTEARKDHGDSELLDEVVSAKPEADHTRYHSPEELKEGTRKHITDAVELLNVQEIHPRPRQPGRRGAQGGVHGIERRAGQR